MLENKANKANKANSNIKNNETSKILVSILMGSSSDWGILSIAYDLLQEFSVSCEALVISAHRMPNEMNEYASSAENKGIQIIIAGAGGAAHLPGMLAAQTIIPVLGVPVPTKYLSGIDSLYSIVQMPKGVPVATFAIGEAGAANAALQAIAILALNDKKLAKKLHEFRKKQNADAVNMQQKINQECSN